MREQKPTFLRNIKAIPTIIFFALLVLFSVMPCSMYANSFTVTDTSTNNNEVIVVYPVSIAGFSTEYPKMTDSITNIIASEIATKGRVTIIRGNIVDLSDSTVTIDNILNDAFDNGVNTVIISSLQMIPERKMAKRCGCYQATDTLVQVSNKSNAITSVTLRFSYHIIDVLSGKTKQAATLNSNALGNNVNEVVQESLEKTMIQVKQELIAYTSGKQNEDHLAFQ